MKKRLEFTLKMLAVATVMAASAAVSAQTAGTWSVKVGVNKITPKVTSGDMTEPAQPGTKVAVGSDTQPILGGSYMFTDNISAELDLGLPYKHELMGDGSIAGTGKLGTAEALPPTLFAQYHFMSAKSAIRPYVGLGLTYAYFQKETGSGALTALTDTGSSTPTTFKLDHVFGVTSQLGLTYALNAKWFADLMISKSYVKTTAHYSTGQTQDVKLDPVAMSLSIGYQF